MYNVDKFVRRDYGLVWFDSDEIKTITK